MHHYFPKLPILKVGWLKVENCGCFILIRIGLFIGDMICCTCANFGQLTVYVCYTFCWKISWLINSTTKNKYNNSYEQLKYYCFVGVRSSKSVSFNYFISL